MSLSYDKVKNHFKIGTGQQHWCENMENWPFSILGIQCFKKFWALKDSYVKWKIKKKRTSRGRKLHTKPIQKSYLIKCQEKPLSTFKLTYFHLVRRNAVIASNTKWTRAATLTALQKEGSGHLSQVKTRMLWKKISIFSFYRSSLILRVSTA